MKLIHDHVVRQTVWLLAAAALVCMFVAPVAHAQQGLSVTVTPPLIQLSIGPGQSWTSILKVVNNNDYEVTYYTQLVDMQPDGEEGRSKFIPLVNEDQSDPTFQSFALARWITVSPDPITIPAGSSANIPFTVTIPANAEPGGHYAAILVGTKPLEGQKGNMMSVSSFVSSLIFVNIKGDVTESGRIREFSTSNSIYQTPNVDFTVRFENTGNTHVHPQGNVTIYNMWGKERGEVAINNGDADFGNVLPASIRRFQFSWVGEQNLFDIGPYSAVVTLNYGQDGKKNVSATTYFWIVPLVPVSIGLGSVLFFILLITWFIRRYVRRALKLEQSRYSHLTAPSAAPSPAIHAPIIETLLEPVREGVIDLRSIGAKSKVTTPVQQSSIAAPETYVGEPLTALQFLSKYRLFIVFLLVVFIAAVSGWWYFARVLEAQRAFQISNLTTQNEATSTQ